MNWLYRFLVSFTFVSVLFLLTYDLITIALSYIDRGVVPGEIGLSFGVLYLIVILISTGVIIIPVLLVVPIIMVFFEKLKRWALVIVAAYAIPYVTGTIIHDSFIKFYAIKVPMEEAIMFWELIDTLPLLKLPAFLLMMIVLWKVRDGKNGFYPLSVITLVTGPILGAIVISFASNGTFHFIDVIRIPLATLGLLVPLAYSIYAWWMGRKKDGVIA